MMSYVNILCYELCKYMYSIMMSYGNIWYGNSLFDTTYKYTHLNILHN